jgi:hypothetical protein
MFSTRKAIRNITLVGTMTFLLGSPAFAQNRGSSRNEARGYANRVVEGTVASVAVGRNGGEHVRLTNGMDLLVPSSITRMRQGRRYTATLRPGDVIRANVYSREGDGRDAQVRSFEILQTVGYNDGRFSGTVISVNRRSNIMAMRTENGRTVNVDLGIFSRGNASARAFRAGDRILVTGRMDRGTVIADDVRIVNNRR